VPILADRGLSIFSEEACGHGTVCSFYWVLHAHGQTHRRGRARPPQEPRPISRLKGRKQPLALRADNGNAMKAATLESRLKDLGVLRSCSRPRISNGTPSSESLFRTA
jgi:hypothetical protein